MLVGVALIGGGIWAKEEHLPAILASEVLSLRAIYSRTLKSAQSINESLSDPVDLYSDEGTDGFDAIVSRSDIQAVVVSLPIKNQAPYIRKALIAGKHVLSEKPVAENLQDAVDMIKWYRTEVKGPSWCIAENWRFLASYEYGRKQIASLGRILAFYGRQHSLVKQSGKWYNTEWRKNPTHQGGFLLDGGVHYMAGIRQLLEAQPGNEISQVSAFTSQLREFLPPVDTAHTVFKTESGITGTFQISVGSSTYADEWTVECENGWIKIEDSKVTLCKDGNVEELTVQNERTGVPPEVREWGKALAQGIVLKEHQPEAALADLELIELMLRSGEDEGATMKCLHQHVKV